MTVNYYSNAEVISPNWQQVCSGCGHLITRGEKSERFRVRLHHDYGYDSYSVEVRHRECRPDWVPKVKEPPLRDARGRFKSRRSRYTGRWVVGDVIRWDQVVELPVGSTVQGTTNFVTYRIDGHRAGVALMMGVAHDGRFASAWGQNSVGVSCTSSGVLGEFVVVTIG